MIHFKKTTFGFEYGNAKVTRLFSNEERGWVTLEVKSDKQAIQIYITKTGKIRIHSKGKEWFPSDIGRLPDEES